MQFAAEVPVRGALGLLLFGLFLSSSQRVLLGGDVEKNPGPNEIEKKIQESVSKLETNLVDSISQRLEKYVENQVVQLMQVVKCQAESLKRIEDAVVKLSKDMTDVKQAVEDNTSAITTLTVKQDNTSDAIGDLQDEVDRLESFSRRNNVRLFGIPESARAEDFDTCAETVKKTLQNDILQINWDNDPVERAHRIGRYNPNNPNPRPIIVKFTRWGDAMKVMRNQEARSKLQENSVRIAQDHTRRQASQLRDLKQVGKSGYFMGGKLCVRDQANTGTTGRWAEGFPNRKSHDAKGGNQNQPTNSADERVNAGARTPTRDVTERPVNRGQFQSVSEVGNTPYVTETPSGPCLRERKTGGGKGRGPQTKSKSDRERQTSLHESWDSGASRAATCEDTDTQE
ncbi:hypothetical protein ACOMHN_017537 [Nucella lapillus]